MTGNLRVGVLATLLGSGGCFSDADAVEPDGGTAGPEGDTATGSTGDRVESDGRDDGGTTEATADSDGAATTQTQDSESTADDGMGVTGDDASGDTGSAPPWTDACRSPPVEGACPKLVKGEAACLAGPVAALTQDVCGLPNGAVVALGALSGEYVFSLLSPTNPSSSPDTSLTVLDGKATGLACVDDETTQNNLISAPISRASFDKGTYDATIAMADGLGTSVPLLMRDASTLCEVEADCCATGGPGSCSNPGLATCVSDIDIGCANTQWDELCIAYAVAICGADCPLTQ